MKTVSRGTAGAGRFALHGYAGVLIIAVAEVLLFSGNRLVGHWFTPIVWTGFILFVDALVYKFRGRSPLMTDRLEFLVVALISIAGWWLFAPQKQFSTEEAGPQSTVVAISATGTQRYVLPDQSVVWLKANARLQVDTQAYKQQVRMVELLAGEAFFEVQKDPAHPFIVQNGAVQTKVLGTSFSVQTGLPGEAVRVTVATGKVAVSHKEKLLNVLLPGKQISVQSKTGAFTENTVPVWLASLWKENELQLRSYSVIKLLSSLVLVNCQKLNN